ncbi:ribbon-helix-helix domain-containing protein [Pseudomonas sp. 10B1]|uniref:ribbon-helix-helix domain-containing protein n=1 Tax=unclassified Pseudomonas TaxID=196821 RepID=UPI002AB4473B|nr:MULTISPECIES: ribbon-helix-helix domain-containing protein [unclassified Pseudomonas]MDY7561264.1 ribbon-helix-helix domain-containing protein [Pseudomonas sp. AB6]MEA9977006.1 ribbon-helix-helix domain-containing protein [Pseudomonas sp. RTS4]MEA9995925.1 ribbon-helix-helix domain-containing protein [Pseudomonas sp. AA4]MEB0087693.1 ribbon-helix-helix domain-containing protein [Pseudomonas sp. RTI1]MEB0127726.1 ribbon-helix-helix domain-containing protein [Pseudomonas sp. CCC1.2]
MVQRSGFHNKDFSRYGKIQDDPFVEDFNMNLARPHSKSVRLNGLATCLRLEEVYWNILANIARANSCSVNAVLSYVDREVHLRHGGVKNFSGLIRVVCVAYLLKAESMSMSPA